MIKCLVSTSHGSYAIACLNSVFNTLRTWLKPATSCYTKGQVLVNELFLLLNCFILQVSLNEQVSQKKINNKKKQNNAELNLLFLFFWFCVQTKYRFDVTKSDSTVLWFLLDLMVTRHLLIPHLFPFGLLRFYCQVMVYSEVTCNQCSDCRSIYIYMKLGVLYVVFFFYVWSESLHSPRLSWPYFCVMFISCKKCIRMQLYCRFLVFPRAGGTRKSCWHMLIEANWELCRLPSNTSLLLTQQPFVPLCRPVLHLSHFRFSHIYKLCSLFVFLFYHSNFKNVCIYDVLLSRYLTKFFGFFPEVKFTGLLSKK